MKSRSLAIFLAAGSFLLTFWSSFALEITPDFKIAKGTLHGTPSVQSCTILADHLEKMFGKRPEIVEASALQANEQAIIVSEDPELEEEEWSIRTSGKNLLLSPLYRNLWDPADPERKYKLYISCKLTGPAYVRGSQQENAVYVDKIVAVKLIE